MDRVVKDYYARRKKRLQARFDANPRIAYGIAKGMGIDTQGMTPKEVWEAISKEGGGTATKTKSQSKEFYDYYGEGSKYTREFKTNGGVSFPKLKKGEAYDEDVLKDICSNAAKNGFGDKLDEIVKNISEDDIVRQKDPVTGETVVSFKGLMGKVDNKVKGRSAECQRIYDEKVKDGKKITDDMVDIVGGLSNARLLGLDNCIKGGASVSRKIDTKREDDIKQGRKPKTDEEYVKGFGDITRFTVKSDHDSIVNTANTVVKELGEKGYKVVELENKYIGENQTYKGVHISAYSKSGQKFEVQIHSDESMAVKNKGHKEYEIARNVETDEKTREAANAKMREYWSKLKDPKGIQKLKGFNLEKK